MVHHALAMLPLIGVLAYIDVLCAMLHHTVDQPRQFVRRRLTACGLLNRALMRRWEPPSALRLRHKLPAAKRSAVVARFGVGLVLLPSTLPSETFVPGHSPNHEIKCLTVFHRLLSVPISGANIFWGKIPAKRYGGF